MILVTGERIIDRQPCPKHVTVPVGAEALIACPWEKEMKSIYWYKETLQSRPILQLEDGVAGGTENGSDRYDIGDDGSMIILNASGGHDGRYIILVIFTDYIFEKTEIVVDVSDD